MMIDIGDNYDIMSGAETIEDINNNNEIRLAYKCHFVGGQSRNCTSQSTSMYSVTALNSMKINETKIKQKIKHPK